MGFSAREINMRRFHLAFGHRVSHVRLAGPGPFRRYYYRRFGVTCRSLSHLGMIER